MIAPFWISAVFIGSLLPGSVKLWLGTKPFQHNHPVELQHRLVHFATFGATTLLFLLAAERRSDEKVLAAAAFLLGCVIEYVQFSTGLSVVLEWWDVRDDFLAAGAVLFVFELARLIHGIARR